jgi:hypothetical protein
MLPCAHHRRSASHAESCILPSAVRHRSSRDPTFQRIDPYDRFISNCFCAFVSLPMVGPMYNQLPDLLYTHRPVNFNRPGSRSGIDIMMLSCVSKAVGATRTQICVRKDGHLGSTKEKGTCLQGRLD